jgi:catechol 2,3-dioxygenase-like lactoylglutathione lyase family enzyme
MTARRELVVAEPTSARRRDAHQGGNGMNKASALGKAHLRIVRPSDDLAANVEFYRDGLGFEVLYEFKDHDGFDAVMMGQRDAAYHLAFVHKNGHKAGRAPSEDNLLVFYLPDADEWTRSVARLVELGHKPVKAFNPYWDKHGKTFEDPDGYRVVLQHASWPA